MDTNQEINELKVIINTMLIEQAQLIAEVSVISNLLFGLVNKTCTEKERNAFYLNYVDDLERAQGIALDEAPSLLFDVPGATAHLQSARFSQFSRILELRRRDLYVNP